MRARDRLLLALALGLVAPPAALAVTAGPGLWAAFAVAGPLTGVVRLGVAWGHLPAATHDVALAAAGALWLGAVGWGGARAIRRPDRGLVRPLLVGAVYFGLTQALSLAAGAALERVDVEGVSMEPALRPGEDVLVAVGGAAGAAQVGDVVLYPGPLSGEPWIKRVIAVEGQVVSSGPAGLLVDGAPVGAGASAGRVARDKGCKAEIDVSLSGEGSGARRWWSVAPTEGPEAAVTVPPGHVYLVGDNRPSSYDSRRHGPVPISALRGVARGVANGRSACGWDLSRWGLVP